eukprot:s768_g2.t1
MKHTGFLFGHRQPSGQHLCQAPPQLAEAQITIFLREVLEERPLIFLQSLWASVWASSLRSESIPSAWPAGWMRGMLDPFAGLKQEAIQ